MTTPDSGAGMSVPFDWGRRPTFSVGGFSLPATPMCVGCWARSRRRPSSWPIKALGWGRIVATWPTTFLGRDWSSWRVLPAFSRCIDPGPILDATEEFLTDHRGAPEPDRVLATVLFTDLVASTPQVAEMGDRRWRNLIATHDALVRAELDRFRGREVRFDGDGVLATFDGPGRAIRCACAIRDALGALGLEVRAGLHTGEIEQNGNDIAGIAVHVGKRVSSLAGPGEVLVSRTVADLVAGSDIELRDKGEHELKGVSGTWRLYSVA